MLTRWIIFLGIALVSLSLDASAQRWAAVNIPAPYDQGYYLDIYFLPNNPLYGWACDNDSGYVVRTVDGGKTWSGTRVSPPGQFCHLEYIQFLDQTTGYCSGPCGVFKSVNGGASWTQLTLPSGVVSIWGGWFRTASVGWVLGGTCGHAQFLRTDDGGTTFTVYTDSAVARSNLSDALWMSDLPNGEVYAAGNGTLWKSTDDGFTWAVASYTGTNSPWHEEIARYGQSFAVACAQSNCNGGGFTGGGVRFSSDGGSSWTETRFTNDIFGTFLQDESRAWASGWRGIVRYTPDKGVNWYDRSCGIGGRNMDDVFFQNDTTGWVVGDGIYHLAPPLRTLSKNSMTFTNVCPDSVKYDTVWVENINFFDSPWELKFVGPEEYLFRVVNAVPVPLPACSRVMVLVEYRAKVPGSHTAQLIINIKNPDTTLVVNLSGFRRAPSAVPTDTLITFNARAGQQTDRVLIWRGTTTPPEQIVDVVRVSGDTSIHFIATLPLTVPLAPATQTFISVVPRDTGWIAARFRVRIAPCMRDTFINVKVYGTSPIINSIPQAAVDIGCSKKDTLLIPVSNTGNIQLLISALRFRSIGPLAFASLGFKSGRPGPPTSLPPQVSDTILVSYTPESGDDVATLEIENDDYTLVRGNKRPWVVELRGLSQKPQAVVKEQAIELGSVCQGANVDTLITVRNDGSNALGALVLPSTNRITGLSSSPVSVTPSSTRTIRFRWTAPLNGDVYDTITVRLQPCDSLVTVIIHAKVITGGIAVAPSPLIDSVLVGGTLTRTVVIRPLAGQTVTLTGISFGPPAADLVVSIPATPVLLRPTDSAVVVFTWNPTTVTRIIGSLQITSEGSCTSQTAVAVDLKSQSNSITVTPTTLSYVITCTKEIAYDTVWVSTNSVAGQILRAPVIVEPGTAFTVIQPTSDAQIVWKQDAHIVVSFDPSIAENSVATLRFVVDPGSETFDVPLFGRFENTTVDRIQTSVGFDTVGICDPIVMRTVEIYNNGNTDEMVDVDLSSAPNGIATALQSFLVSAVSSTTVTIQCDPSQMNVGSAIGSIVFRGRTCPDTTSIDVSAELVGGRLQMQPDPVNAGNVVRGNSVVRTVTITNPTAIARRIVQLSIEPPSPDWSLVGSVDGMDVTPGAPLPIDVRFTPTANGDRNATLRLIDAERCTTQSTISLLGRGQDPDVPPQHILNLQVDEYRVAPSTHLLIPVRWTNDVQPLIIDTVRFSVVFSPLHFIIDSVLVGDLLDAVVEMSWFTDRAHFVVARNGTEFGKAGTIALLSGTANPAIPDSTPFTFVDVGSASTEPVTVKTNDGLLVIDACGPRNMITLKAPTTVRVMPPNPVNDILNLHVQAPYSQHLHVRLVNALGNAVADLGEYDVGSGETIITIRMPVIASGMYGIAVQTDQGGIFNAIQTVVR